MRESAVRDIHIGPLGVQLLLEWGIIWLEETELHPKACSAKDVRMSPK